MGTMVLEWIMSRPKLSRSFATHDSSPTPNPLTNLPTTMVLYPTVKVWIAPPIVKITAPPNSVPFLPMMSPIRPAAIEVTVGRSAQTANDKYNGTKLTKRANL
jgi:hypothetical protein